MRILFYPMVGAMAGLIGGLKLAFPFLMELWAIESPFAIDALFMLVTLGLSIVGSVLGFCFAIWRESNKRFA